MAMTRRGRLSSIVGIVVVVGGLAVGALALGGKGPAGLVGKFVHEDPPRCPLTGQIAPGGAIPDRPALAVKVENLPESRPQTGLGTADIVFEEPVEAGITRFIPGY